MKWLVVASVICCGGLLLVILLGANISLVAGIFLDFWPAILVGLLLLIVGLVYYVRRRLRSKRKHYWR